MLRHKPNRILLIIVLFGSLTAFGLFCFFNLFEPAFAQNPIPPVEHYAKNGGVEVTATEAISLDVMVVMDVSISMELFTTCVDCWRAFDDISTLPDEDLMYPTNGYVNPLPFDPNHPDVPKDVFGESVQQSIPKSSLCTQPPNFYENASIPGRRYVVLESELYSANSSNWDVQARAPGRGVWVLQRGSRNSSDALGNMAGQPDRQSSNLCNPGVQGLDIDCTLGGKYPNTICDGPDDPDKSYDCSAYVKAQTYATYQGLAVPFLTGGTFDSNCFGGSSVSGTCWNDPTAPSGPGNIPMLEYDFTPQWDGNTTIWIRAQGGGSEARAWQGWIASPFCSTCVGYRNTVFWQVDNSTIQGNNDTEALGAYFSTTDYRDNRARYDRWAWIKLGTVDTGPYNAANPDQHTLRIYQGSPGYKIDKIIFANHDGGSSGSPPAAMLENNGKGPRATTGSATREACNVCNPAYGYTVSDTDCSCKWKPWDGASTDATNCTSLPTGTTDYSQLNNDLYTGLEPIRSSQEAIKRFATKLDPRFDQLGFVAFSNNVVAYRSKLQCFQYAALQKGDAGECYDDTRFTKPISFTDVMRTVEKQRPLGGTNIADSLREGLQELGVNAYGSGYVDSSCNGDPNNNDNGRSCDRRGAARKVLILLTDGAPNANSNCKVAPDYNDFWDNPDSGNNVAFECAMYYGWVAANNNVIVYTIGLGAGLDPDILAGIATGVDPRGDQPDVTMFWGTPCSRYFAAPTSDDLGPIMDEILIQARTCQSDLAITKTAPPAVVIGTPITYTLTITNNGTVTATNLIITDVIPANAHYVSGGVRDDNVVGWHIPSLAANGGMTQTTFIVTATQSVTNREYAVQADGGYRAVGQAAVSTVVTPSGSDGGEVFLPVIFKE